MVDPSGCWLWQGKPDRGYGQVHWPLDGKRNWLAHRLVALLLGFPLGENMHHECRTPMCVNPEHLAPLTAAEHSHGHTKTHCKHGHPLDDAYRGIRSNGLGYVICRGCKAEVSRRKWAAMTPAERAVDNAASSERRRQRKGRTTL